MHDDALKRKIHDHLRSKNVYHTLSLLELEYAYREHPPEEVRAAMMALVEEGWVVLTLDSSLTDLVGEHGKNMPMYRLLPIRAGGMTAKRIKEAFDSCEGRIDSCYPGYEAVELDEESKKDQLKYVGHIGHMKFMCQKGKELVTESFVDPRGPYPKREKAMRWLGFLQGALWGQGLASIDEMKHWNMPTEERVILGDREHVRTPDGHINNCALANGDMEENCQVCGGRCPDHDKFNR